MKKTDSQSLRMRGLAFNLPAGSRAEIKKD